MEKSLSDIRHLLVIAAQKEYDDRIAKGAHPYSMASWQFSNCISEELAKHVDISDWKAGNWRELNKAIDKTHYNKLRDPFSDNEDVDFASGQWAVGAVLNSNEAWATPGFAEAYRYHSIHGG
tara:strand:+ start:6751 stop:7116 length:366 start_codon:yes stop_codon:yes gene_type:complete